MLKDSNIVVCFGSVVLPNLMPYTVIIQVTKQEKEFQIQLQGVDHTNQLDMLGDALLVEQNKLNSTIKETIQTTASSIKENIQTIAEGIYQNEKVEAICSVPKKPAKKSPSKSTFSGLGEKIQKWLREMRESLSRFWDSFFDKEPQQSIVPKKSSGKPQQAIVLEKTNGDPVIGEPVNVHAAGMFGGSRSLSREEIAVNALTR